MRFELHLPDQPENAPAPAPVPMIYVSEPLAWQYKQVVRHIAQEGLLDEAALNELGQEGWELAAVVTQALQATYIFKRLAV